MSTTLPPAPRPKSSPAARARTPRAAAKAVAPDDAVAVSPAPAGSTEPGVVVPQRRARTLPRSASPAHKAHPHAHAHTHADSDHCEVCAIEDSSGEHRSVARLPRPTLIIHSPAGAVLQPASLDRASKRLTRMGFDVTLAEHAKARVQRFAGDDEQRIADLHATARACPDVALASRGGYGLTRLLDGIDWKLIAASVDAGVKWVGHSDLTAFQMALLAHTRRPSWTGPMAAFDFGRSKADLDEITCDCFVEAMTGQLEALGFKTSKGHDGLDKQGVLWGGNLTVLCSLLGTRHWPRIAGGILYLEDVAEAPYRIERQLLQLHQCGVLAQQSAIVLGDFTECRTGPMDGGYSLKTVVAHLREQIATPILTGAPVGHDALKVTLPVGRSVRLDVQGREAMIRWAD